jgi:microcin C transport system ATP-binding protein
MHEATTAANAEPRSRDHCVLRLDDLCIRFGKTPVVRHLSLDVKRGECLAIVGESG